ncbi:MAG: hypothetical protein RMJ13_04640 [Elusimicrobiota bacterium]|nr:hypothetical protein [Endomicrobiia bacterium]MDW8055975.1 hypothetical protein [Elusimicrobiota bacterium]
MNDLIITLKKLIQLQIYDQEIIDLEEEINSIPDQISQLEKTIESLQKNLDTDRNQLKDLQLKIKNRELDLQSVEQQIKKHTQELNTVKTNEQYRALLTEIDNLNKQKDQVEIEIIELMETIDKSKAKTAAAEKEFSLKREEIQKQIENLKQKKQNLENTLTEKIKEREDFAKNIQQKFLSQYERIRKSRDGAMSPVVQTERGYSCGKCNMRLTEQEISDINKYEEFIFCSSCSRILYIPKDLEEHQNIE